MRTQDQVILALTIWRENRGGGLSGMQSVASAIMNRVARHKTDPYTECLRPLQFSSMTAKGDPELTLWPNDDDPQWDAALGIAAQAAVGALEDLTNGATVYYNPAGIVSSKTIRLPSGDVVAFPNGWNAARLRYQCTVAKHLFFVEL